MFLAEINGLEVVRDNQKIYELSTSFTPGAVDVHGSLVAVGGQVAVSHTRMSSQRLIMEVHRMEKSDCTIGTENR